MSFFIRLPLALLAAGLALASASSALAWPWDHKDLGPKIPRWAALKFGMVNARAGPGDDTRILFVYRSRGLPLQILAETRDWKRVCDSDGALSWVKSTALTERRTVLRKAQAPLPLRAAPAPAARVTSYMAGRSTAEVETERGGWIKLKGAGWLMARDVWGADNRPQCR